MPKPISEQLPFYLRFPFNVLIAGILPFGAAFVQIYFIMCSFWANDKFYYLFGFLFVVFFVVTAISAEISIVFTYFTLSYENYHWWWRSFFIGGSVAVYIPVFSTFYYLANMNVGNLLMLLQYFWYMALVSLFVFLLNGTIGFLASFLFVRKIYSSIKVN